MKLEKRVAKDFKDIQAMANSLFAYSSNEIGKKIELANKDCLATVAAVLSNYPDKITYFDLTRDHTIDRLRDVLNRRYLNLAIELEDYWSYRRDQFDILSRLAVAFIGRKASPPWVKSVINLKTELSQGWAFDPRKGHFRLYLRKMVDAIINQLQQGALSEETMTAMLRRVRNMFDREQKNGVREAAWKPIPLQMEDPSIDDEGDWSQELYGPANMTEGTYTYEDFIQFRGDLAKANNWSYREYRPWFTDAVKRNNRYLRDLEQLLYADATRMVQEGLVQIGDEEMGITDMVWVAAIGATTCDDCRERDGMTMTEIADKLGDDTPPALHPNCYCKLAPKIKDDWADKQLKKAGIEWSPEDGILYNATADEKSLGIQDMTFDQYLATVPQP